MWKQVLHLCMEERCEFPVGVEQWKSQKEEECKYESSKVGNSPSQMLCRSQFKSKKKVWSSGSCGKEILGKRPGPAHSPSSSKWPTVGNQLVETLCMCGLPLLWVVGMLLRNPTSSLCYYNENKSLILLHLSINYYYYQLNYCMDRGHLKTTVHVH